jgi:hypothetical protein
MAWSYPNVNTLGPLTIWVSETNSACAMRSVLALPSVDLALPLGTGPHFISNEKTLQ